MNFIHDCGPTPIPQSCLAPLLGPNLRIHCGPGTKGSSLGYIVRTARQTLTILTILRRRKRHEVEANGPMLA